ncbi:hypothetical protein QE152_g24556 [Popillia japonica]|uniref:Uncharacterized protein n=1 Tax=Popillia japonica TaxID=7064 RepID=A0AAW1KF63_POPJA
MESGDKTYVRHANQMLNSQISDSSEPNSAQNKSTVTVVSNNQNTNYSFINPPMHTYNNIKLLQQASPPTTSRNSIIMNVSPKKDVPDNIPVLYNTLTRRTNQTQIRITADETSNQQSRRVFKRPKRFSPFRFK